MRKLLKIITAVALMGSMCLSAGATDLSDLREDLSEQEDKKKEAQSVVGQLTTDRDNILGAIAALDGQVAEYNAQIAELEVQKGELEANIAKTEIELAAAEKEEATHYDAMKERIKYSYENGDINYMDTIFSSADVSDIVNRSEYVEQIYKYDSNQLDELMEIRKTIANSKLQLQTDLASVEEIEAEVKENKEAVEIMIVGKEDQIKNYELYIDDYQDVVNQIQADIDATNEAIAAAEAAARQEGSSLGDIQINYTGGTFQWPVSTGGVITSHFGPRWGRVHQGIDIGCPTGTPILAGEAGVVIAAAYSSSMGNYVLIDHGGGVSTVYMHNSSLAVSYGQQVSRGEVIAYAGSTGRSTGPHCHFGLRINGTYVDPYPYLVQ